MSTASTAGDSKRHSEWYVFKSICKSITIVRPRVTEVYACVSAAYGLHVYWWGVWLYKCMIDVTMCLLVEPEIIQHYTNQRLDEMEKPHVNFSSGRVACGNGLQNLEKDPLQSDRSNRAIVRPGVTEP